MADYLERLGELRKIIAADRALRDAQVFGADHYNYFQTRITECTSELRAWERNLPRLRELERQIRATERTRREQQLDAERHSAAWHRNAALAAGVAVLGVILAITAGMVLGWVLAVVFGLAVVGCLWRADPAHAGRAPESVDAELANLYQERNNLTPQPATAVPQA